MEGVSVSKLLSLSHYRRHILVCVSQVMGARHYVNGAVPAVSRSIGRDRVILPFPLANVQLTLATATKLVSTSFTAV